MHLSALVIDAGESLVCKFTDLSGTVEDQVLMAEMYIDNATVVCKSPPNDLVDPYPNMYPTKLEISLDGCDPLICDFGNHYSETDVGNLFSFYEDPIVETLGFEPYNSGLMDGLSIGYPLSEGAESVSYTHLTLPTKA